MDDEVDILLATATEGEIEAVIKYVEETYNRKCLPKRTKLITFYYLGVIGGAKIMLARSGMGTEGVRGSSQTLADAIKRINPKIVIAVGIAFGVNRKKQKIGDVLISNQIQQYGLQKVDKEGEIIPRGDRVPASAMLIDRCEDGALFWDKSQCKIHFGLLLTGNSLVDNFDYRTYLIKNFAVEAIGGEMEGSGIYDASAREGVHWIIIKAICDWADGTKKVKKKERQQIAADNAIRFTFHMIEREGLSSNKKNDGYNDSLSSFRNEVQSIAREVRLFKQDFSPHTDMIIRFGRIANGYSYFSDRIMNWIKNNNHHSNPTIEVAIPALTKRMNLAQSIVSEACSNAQLGKIPASTASLDSQLVQLAKSLDSLAETLSQTTS